MMPRCPDPARLQAFTLGKIEAQGESSMASHLESCSSCGQRLQAFMDEKDLLVASLQGAPRWDFLEEDGFTKGLQRTRQLAATAPPVVVERPLPAALGQYRLLEVLGQGGMGVVYKALHVPLEKIVAVKVLSPRRLADPDAVLRFQREARAVARLEHPHIVRAMDAGEAGGEHFLVMELVSGMDLAALVQRAGALPMPEACEMVRQAASGLQHAFEHGVVHRDIKPSNLMLTPEGEAKILDLGLASSVVEDRRGGLTQSGYFLGTLAYAAPEQIDRPSDVDIRADIYSLGCTLYYLLTRQVPFARWEPTQSHDEPGHLGTLRSDLPAELIAVVQRAVARDRKDRPATPRELAEALRPFAAAPSQCDC